MATTCVMPPDGIDEAHGPQPCSRSALPDNLKISQHNTADGYHVLETDESHMCSFFIKRKERSCRRRAADGSEWCSLHEPEALQAERARTALPQHQTGIECPGQGSTAARAGGQQEEQLGGEGGEAADGADAPAEPGEKMKKTRLSGWRRRRQKAKMLGTDEPLPGRISATSRRMRNPFSEGGSPLVLPSWDKELIDVSRPTLLDIGCARGVFAEQAAALFPGHNYIGLEIREGLVEEALKRTADLRERQSNLVYMAGNVLQPEVMDEVLRSLRDARVNLQVVAFQFPDPWVASKHRKRRTVSSAVASSLAANLTAGARVYVSSDVPQVVTDAAEVLNGVSGLFQHSGDQTEAPGGSEGELCQREPPTDGDGFLKASPIGCGRVFSERDVVCEDLWRRVYRVLFVASAPPIVGGVHTQPQDCRAAGAGPAKTMAASHPVDGPSSD